MQSDQIHLHEIDAVPVSSQSLSELEDFRRAQEVGGADYFLPELEHKAPPVELQASRPHHQD